VFSSRVPDYLHQSTSHAPPQQATAGQLYTTLGLHTTAGQQTGAQAGLQQTGAGQQTGAQTGLQQTGAQTGTTTFTGLQQTGAQQAGAQGGHALATPATSITPSNTISTDFFINKRSFLKVPLPERAEKTLTRTPYSRSHLFHTPILTSILNKAKCFIKGASEYYLTSIFLYLETVGKDRQTHSDCS